MGIKLKQMNKNLKQRLVDYKAAGGVLNYGNDNSAPMSISLAGDFLCADLDEFFDVSKSDWDSIGN